MFREKNKQNALKTEAFPWSYFVFSIFPGFNIIPRDICSAHIVPIEVAGLDIGYLLFRREH